ncbi:MAG: galactan 5-O-arabinofuranosyltransferase [Frankiaceae bacterium]|nr:galactan 5-O-arabinofuranosyltransferase [Frankiaceae bacterium]
MPARLAPVAPALSAVLVWLAFVGAGLIVRHEVAARALHVDVQTTPLAVGFVLVIAVALVVWRRGVTPALAGVFLGLLAGWVSFQFLISLAGTPYGIGSVYGDCGRTVAAAEQFRWHWGSSDQFIKGNPSQYPPLYFWIWGRLAALTGRHAYQVQGVYQSVSLGAVILLAAGAWRLVLSWPRAVAAAAVTSGLLLVADGYDPCKGHEISAALLTAPVLLFTHFVVLAAIAGRRRWWAAALAGALAGLALLLYQLFVLFSLPGLLVFWIVVAYRGKQLRALIAHLAVAAAAGFAVVSWYVVPLVPRLLSNHYPRASDPLMVFFTLGNAPGLPVTGNLVIAVVALAAAGLLAWRPARPAAAAIIAIIASALLVQVLALFNVVKGGESFYSYRTVPWLIVICGAAVVVLVDVAVPPPGATRRVVAVGAALLLLVSMHSAWSKWHQPSVGVEAQADTYLADRVANHEPVSNELAYVTPLPNCDRVRGLPASVSTTVCFPASAAQQCVHAALGDRDPRPVLVSYDDRMAEFFGDHLYLGTNAGATNALDAWPERVGVLESLAAQQDPQRFLDATRHTKFGRIRGYVLAVQRNGEWRWVTQIYHGHRTIDFAEAQFTDPAWHICRSRSTVIAIDTGG